MTEYMTEQEQIQQLKMWFKQYGTTILIGIVLALLLSTGWRYWQNYRNNFLMQASIAYDEMQTFRAQNNLDAATSQAKNILTKFSNTPYASLAALELARTAVLNKNYSAATKQLNWVLAHSSESSIREIARLRLARIFITLKQENTALDLLKKVDDKSFLGMIDEVRGDAFSSLNNFNSAKKSYELALSEIPNAEITRPILQMKYDNLAVNTKA